MEAFLSSFGFLSPTDIRQLVDCFSLKQLNKNDFFSREGERCTEVAFIRTGIFRSFYLSDQGDDITYCFRFPNEMMAAYSSFITGQPSVESLQAITTAEVLVTRKQKLDQLFADNPDWIKVLKVIAEQQYLELEKRMFQFQKERAPQRYERLLKEQPDYIRQIPLQYLASYLGITQRHLSRIRKSVKN